MQREPEIESAFETRGVVGVHRFTHKLTSETKLQLAGVNSTGMVAYNGLLR